MEIVNPQDAVRVRDGQCATCGAVVDMDQVVLNREEIAGDDLLARAEKACAPCGSCDFGLVEYGCTCSRGEDPRAVIVDLLDALAAAREELAKSEHARLQLDESSTAWHETWQTTRAEVDKLRAQRQRNAETLRFARLALQSIKDVSSRAEVCRVAANAINHINDALADTVSAAAPLLTCGTCYGSGEASGRDCTSCSIRAPRCPSCDHLAVFHTGPEGCRHAVTVAAFGSNIVCPCGGRGAGDGAGVALLETTIRDNLEHSIGEFLLSHARKTVALALDEEQIPDHGQAALLMYAGSYLECAGEEIMSGKWRTQ